MSGDPIPCARCGALKTRVVWSGASMRKALVDAVLIPAWMLAGYFGDMKGAYLPLEHRCERCGTRFTPRGARPHHAGDHSAG